MKPTLALRSFLALTGSVFLAAQMAQATILTWDAGGGGGAITNGGGAWLGAGLWNNAGAAATWTSGDDAIFAGPATNGGAVTLASPTVANTLTFSPSFTGTYTLGTIGQALTINSGITKDASSGAVTIISPITLGGSQTWTNNSTNALTLNDGTNSTINTAGHTLTFGGTGTFNIVRGTGIGGTGSVIVDAAYLDLRGGGVQSVNTFSGGLTVQNGGEVLYFSQAGGTGGVNLGSGNIQLNGGILAGYFNQGFTHAFGSGAGQFQITGGESGFGVNGSMTVNFSNVTSVQWGSASFNPSKFVLGGGRNGGTVTFAENIDLNNANRTVTTTVGGVLSGVLSTSSGTGGLIKEGAGTLTLSNTNTYNGTTTISAGTLIANSTAALGNSSATNTLIFNGGTLQAGAAFTSAATRAVTMTATGSINTNNFAVGILGNISGAGGLTKNGNGTLTLSGTNSYGGVTTVNTGTLQFATQASLYNNTPASWTAANINVKSGAVLALNVDSAGSAGFSSSNLNTLLGNISVANTAAEGLQSGATLSLDTSTATGASFTPSSAITDSTGAFGGKINLLKLGAGTLVLDQANTYTGTTTINAGTLQLNDGGSISAAPLHLNGGTFASNRSGTTTFATIVPGYMAGTGGLANVGAGTLVLDAPTYHTGNTTPTAGNITLNHASAIQNSALNTTGAGTVTLGTGVTSPTFGGLSNSGTTRNLASVIDSSYANVTNLTLNPQSGSITYGGVIADGAAGMTLTKTGAGTQILQGTNTYTGATNINAGTLTLSGASGAIASTAINLNGGGLTLDNTTNSGTRISDSATITVNGSSSLTFSHAGATGVNYTETIDTLSLQSGFLTYTGSQANATGPRTSNLQFNTLSRSGTATVNFAGTGLGTNGRNTIKFGAGVTNGVDLGPWAVVNGADFASYSTANGIVAATSTAVAASSNNASTNWRWDNNIVIDASLNPSYKTFFTSSSGAARSLGLNGNTVSVGGISTTGNNGHVINGTGALQALSAGDALYVNVGANALAISSAIQNVGAGATASALVKFGSGQLTLSGTNTYTGGTVLNAGTLAFDSALNIGGTNNTGGSTAPITVNGTSTMTTVSNTAVANLGTGAISINNGATLTLTGASRGTFTIGGAITGNGGVTLGYGSFWGKAGLNSTSNTFEGALTLTGGNDDGNSLFSINSIADGAGYGNIILNVSSSEGDFIGLDYGTGGTNGAGGGGAVAPLVLNNRQIVIQGTSINTLNNSSNQALTINTDIGFSGTGARAIRLGLQARAGSGINTFAGKLTDNVGGALSVTSGGGTWNFTNSNTYTGATTILAGTLNVSTLANGGVASNIGASTNAAGSLILNGGTLRYTGAAVSTDRLFSLQTSSTIDASGTGAVNFTNSGSMGFNGGTAAKTLTLTGSNTGDNTIAAVIGNLTGATSVVKNGIGTWVLGGNTNSYTGTTTLNTGRLVLDYAASNTTKLANGAALTLGGGTLELSGGSHTEVVASTTLTNNTGTSITQTNSGTSVLQLGTISRPNGGSTLSFSADSIATTNNTNVNGILGPGYTVGSHWAVNSTNGTNGAIVALSSYTTTVPTITGVNTANYQLTGSQTQTGSTVGNTLRIVSSANNQVLDLGNNRNFSLNSANGVMGSLIYAGGANNNYTINGTGTSAIVPTTGNNHVGLNVFTGTLTVNALLGSGSGTVTKWGAGTLVIGSNNTAQSGAHLVQEGTLRLANNGATGTTAGGIVVSNGAALELSNSVAIGAEALTISGYGISDAGALRNVAGNTSSYAGAITLNTATSVGGARINSDAGGALTLTGGVVTSQYNNVTFGGAGNTTVQTTAISGAGGLIKDGAGVTTLTAANTFTGATAVNAGTLRVNGAGAINTSSGITVAAGGTLLYNSSTSLTKAPVLNGTGTGSGQRAVLGGEGSINAAVTLDNIGDVLSPGNSPGIMTFETNQTWASNSYDWEINSWTADVAGTNIDQINITGILDLSAASADQYVLNVLSLTGGDVSGLVPDFTNTSNSWTILTASGITGFNASEWDINTAGFTNPDTGTWSISKTGNNLTLNYTVIPEPSSALLVGLSSLLLFRRRR